MLAVEFGARYGSCAQQDRLALGPGATQAQWWRVCPRGDWLLWQLGKVGRGQHPALGAAVERIVARAIRRGLLALRGERAPWATVWRRWARRWLSGEDRSLRTARAVYIDAVDAVDAIYRDVLAARAAYAAAAAAYAAYAAAAAAYAAADAAYADAAYAAAAAAAAATDGYAARAAELRRQARDIRRAIPEWDKRWEVE